MYLLMIDSQDSSPVDSDTSLLLVSKLKQFWVHSTFRTLKTRFLMPYFLQTPFSLFAHFNPFSMRGGCDLTSFTSKDNVYLAFN